MSRSGVPASLKALHDASPDAVLVLEPQRGPDGEVRDFRLLHANPAALRSLGLGDAPLQGLHLSDVLSEETLGPGQRAVCVEVAESGLARVHECAHRVQAHQRWFRTTTVRLEGLLHVTFADITAEKRAEEALEVLAAASGSLSTSLSVDATLKAVLSLLVPRVAEFCALDVRESGLVRTRVAVHGEPSRSQALGHLQRLLTFGRAGALDVLAVLERGEPLLLTDVRGAVGADAASSRVLDELDVRSLLLAPLSAHGESVGLLVVGTTSRGRTLDARDVPLVREVARRAAGALENARLFELSRQERTRAEEANRAKDEFLAIVSHELRQPLNAMLGWLRLYRSGGLTTDQRERALETVERNVLAQGQLVEDLLDVSRIITGKLRLQLRRVQVEGLLATTLETVSATAHTKGIRLSTRVDAGLPAVSADPERMQQVLWNLLSNAIKFTPRGGQVSVRLSRLEDAVELSVTDTGVGIPGAFLPYVFERFRQAEPSATRTHRGLGLGLAIVKYVVEQHGGTVSADSAGEGRGATFTVRLPLAGAGASESEVESLPPAVPTPVMAPEGARLLAGLSVLVAEDEPDACEVLVTIFQASGARVARARTAAEALELVPRLRPDVLVFDIGLPDEDGYALIGRVRNLPPESGGATPAVALTGYARTEDRTRAFLAGFQLHLPKPVEPAELVAVVANLAGRRLAR
ncbi:MAG: ATP-binding protein [Myxococcaceae bacterium]|nr:ATP-binding protein [Myxococcaceae bacterium]